MESNDWNDAERRVERAQELFEQHRWQEALAELRAATSINPYNSAWFYNLGLTLDQLGRHEEAIAAYEQSLAIDPRDVQALHRLGANLHELGRYHDAIAALERVEQVDSTYEPAYCGRILSYAELGAHDLAEQMFYLARLHKEQCPQCFYNMGISLFARGLFDKALYCWDQVQNLDPLYPQLQLRIAEAQWGKGELELARQHYLAGLRQEPGDTTTLLDLSELLCEMGRTDEAEEKIRRAVELAPDAPAAHFALGRWLLRRHAAGAETALQRTIQLDPTYPGAHLQLARVFQARQNNTEARRQLRAELLLRPDDPQILMDLANLLVDLGETRPALACLKRLVQFQPENARAWQNLAVVQFMRHRYSEGIASSAEALRHNPRNIMAIHNLALALGKTGDHDQAIEQVQRGLAKSPKDLALQRLEVRLHMMRLKSRMLGAVRRILRSRSNPRD
jgi:tetratricopeptide (TPR) repeat protein